MANDSSAYSYMQGNSTLSSEERYRMAQEGYGAVNTARQLQPHKQTVKKPVNKPDIIMIKTEKKGSAPKAFLAGASAFLLLACVIYGKVQTNEIYNDISAANQELVVLQSENVRMQSELEGKMTITNVAEYAEQVLGLQIIDPSQIEYIQIQTDDVVEIPDEEKNIFVKVKDKFVSFMEYLRG